MMASFNQRSLLDRFIGACFGFLAGAGALYVAVRLVESIVWALCIIVGLGVSASAAVVLLQRRNRGW
jgi:hypothetical protein